MSTSNLNPSEGMMEAWSRLSNMPVFQRGHDLIAFVEAHRTQGYFKNRLPFITNGALLLFKFPPRPADFFQALIQHLSPPIYNTNIFEGESEATKGWFIQEMTCPKLDQQYQALLVALDYSHEETLVLKHCVPQELLPGAFSRANFLPYVFQDVQHPQLLLNCTGSISETHVNYGIVGGLSTVIEGDKLFLSWPPSKKNLELFQALHHFSTSWDQTFKVIKQLEDLHVNHVKAGMTVYIPAGQLHLVFSPKLAFLHGLWIINPTVEEWDTVQKMFVFLVEHIEKRLRPWGLS
ncbi:uncharacterized protein UTRI_10074 [Ustilago trichophora]|uniref:JmjC domain-containing protein n=1 Tax=Ustilago trichophora TaxID=86804 RepID=A0A5C3E1R6_9BASI|nr:uncharacterized protein UTRI_10074 [Ustilago trichophora]